MNPDEISLLVTGFGIGAQSILVLHMVGDMRAARRGQTEAEAALKRAAGDRWLNDFRLYRLRQRSRA
ncbi:hypothetical protein [Streptomyces sp. NPDC059786]|uniref:hypothetical protein n=1 Tax=Streptomyces sp. NPDC059786 TaxID=3346946 RepID=UPI00364F9B06